ncbi:hypothetical protein BLOT_002881 [Blomia tropicalis]|nr:hypothetical protein BLOT_002881 [Blomia tropicalis]
MDKNGQPQVGHLNGLCYSSSSSSSYKETDKMMMMIRNSIDGDVPSMKENDTNTTDIKVSKNSRQKKQRDRVPFWIWTNCYIVTCNFNIKKHVLFTKKSAN